MYVSFVTSVVIKVLLFNCTIIVRCIDQAEAFSMSPEEILFYDRWAFVACVTIHRVASVPTFRSSLNL
jgi:hypothetical protein